MMTDATCAIAASYEAGRIETKIAFARIPEMEEFWE